MLEGPSIAPPTVAWLSPLNVDPTMVAVPGVPMLRNTAPPSPSAALPENTDPVMVTVAPTSTQMAPPFPWSATFPVNELSVTVRLAPEPWTRIAPPLPPLLFTPFSPVLSTNAEPLTMTGLALSETAPPPSPPVLEVNVSLVSVSGPLARIAPPVLSTSPFAKVTLLIVASDPVERVRIRFPELPLMVTELPLRMNGSLSL